MCRSTRSFNIPHGQPTRICTFEDWFVQIHINFIDEKSNDFALAAVNQPCSKEALLFSIHFTSSCVATYKASRISFADIFQIVLSPISNRFKKATFRQYMFPSTQNFSMYLIMKTFAHKCRICHFRGATNKNVCRSAHTFDARFTLTLPRASWKCAQLSCLKPSLHQEFNLSMDGFETVMTRWSPWCSCHNCAVNLLRLV